MEQAEIEARLTRLLTERLQLAAPAEGIDSGTGLVGHGLQLDSVALLEFVVGIEEEFDVLLDDNALTVEHFGSLGGLARYVSDVMRTASA